MTAFLRLLAAWTRRDNRPVQADRPGNDEQFGQWLGTVRADKPLCSCNSRRLVLIHSAGTYCGDEQAERVSAAVRSVFTVSDPVIEDEVAAAVLDMLRGDQPDDRDVEFTDLDAW